MESDFEEVVYSENVIDFATLATEYCNLLDGVALLSQKEFIDKAHRLLPLVYLKAIILPDTEAEMPELIDKSVTQEEWEAVYNTMVNKLHDVDSYNEILDPLNDTEAMASLSEGFADIYQDLKDFMVLYNMGTPEIMNDAIWECKNNFKAYWGQRLVNIQRVLHNLFYGNQSLNENDALSEDDFDPEKRDEKNRQQNIQ
ncbi:MAG: DUF5063 domain-containing protein [Salinivirgaceae bacterium]|nr:DUF5063 domain-containing protein [Salinivirgaceae bacterium]